MKKYILYADDDQDDYEILQNAFAEISEQIGLVHVSNGYDVISHLQNRAQSDYPSLILMDINMPLLGGKETLELLKIDDHYKTIPVKIFSTAFSPADKAAIEQNGAEVIKKPSIYDGWRKIAAELAKYCTVWLLCSLVH